MLKYINNYFLLKIWEKMDIRPYIWFYVITQMHFFLGKIIRASFINKKNLLELYQMHYAIWGGGGGICIPLARRAGGGGTGLNMGGLGGGGGTGTIELSPGLIKGTAGGGGTLPTDGFSFLNANCRKNCFVSLFQWVQNFPSAFSTSLLGTWKLL